MISSQILKQEEIIELVSLEEICKLCGICAVFNLDNAIRLAGSVLLNQDDRGKDSSGIAYIIKNNKIEIQKKALEPEKFVEQLKFKKSSFSLAHNRNATTNVLEKDKDKEAHPFISESKDFVICHNGHITYHDVLRNFLELIGHKFSTGGVDSEVLVHILEELLERYSRDIAMKRFFHILDGENVLVLFKDKELWGYPTNSYFKIIKIDNGIIIASTFDSFAQILEATEGDVMGYYPSTIGSNQMIKAVMEDDRVSLSLFGNWDEGCFKHEDFIAHNKIMCDYCKESVITERFDEHDRCLDCYKANKDKTMRELQSHHTDGAIPYMSLTNSTLKDIWGSCEICGSFLCLDRMTFCHICNKILCRECSTDQKKHGCRNPVYID